MAFYSQRIEQITKYLLTATIIISSIRSLDLCLTFLFLKIISAFLSERTFLSLKIFTTNFPSDQNNNFLNLRKMNLNQGINSMQI